ncbi:hypothetical protein HCC61_13800 [Streptomyces sp. HNM0575]|uniref:hypothetical protein n=1 Tax=Streptomyces sp. HNM0575 TaxID=2716338 RepID=UPI00145E6483|nr:hypothetical protein [Streptomyces sp. HNM0575]NLU73740.1 hypothetical protein [Streptomyces sp. HNM0575]
MSTTAGERGPRPGCAGGAEMAGCIRRLPARRVLTAAAAMVAAWLVWRLTAHTAPPAGAMAPVLGWGLGLLPVHVTLTAPRRRGGEPRVRRPAQEYEWGRRLGWERTGTGEGTGAGGPGADTAN